MLGALGDDGAAQAEATGVVEGLDGGDLAQLFDDSGEHFPGPPASSGTDSGAADDDRKDEREHRGRRRTGPASTADRYGGAHGCPPAAHCLPSGL
ncbi:hypothetical protein GCM10019016_093130 [Streptomyces prasinosporus]|uniref:Uncharacterized protein n=1 Tax=Streptomyces prasinosporus TaxID=68256 RepID=A0ABP6U5I2_9ACTN